MKTKLHFNIVRYVLKAFCQKSSFWVKEYKTQLKLNKMSKFLNVTNMVMIDKCFQTILNTNYVYIWQLEDLETVHDDWKGVKIMKNARLLEFDD